MVPHLELRHQTVEEPVEGPQVFGQIHAVLSVPHQFRIAVSLLEARHLSLIKLRP